MASPCPGEQSRTAKQPVTEMAFLHFPPQTRLHDPSTEAGTIWRRVLKDVSLAEGFRSQIWGYETNAPGTVWYLVGICRPSHAKLPLLLATYDFGSPQSQNGYR